MSRTDRSRTLFTYSLVFTAFAYGFISAYAKLPPYNLLVNSWNTVVDLSSNWENDVDLVPTRHLVSAPPGRKRFSVIRPQELAPGYRLIVGLTWGKKALYGATLYTVDGKELYYWPIDYSKVNPGDKKPQNVFPHGFTIYPDGSFVVNFDDGSGIAHIDSCGKIIWVQNKPYSHTVSRDPDGTLWTLRGPVIVQLDANSGKEIRQISITKDILEKFKLQGIFALRTEEQETGLRFMSDPYHLNDVEVLFPGMAAAFPMFRAGDLLISLRSLNMVAVIDRNDYHPKWWQIGPWHRQHDPDFLPDGTISMLNNNMGFGHSNIMTVNPQTGKVEVVAGGDGGFPFYTWRRGKQEHLDNNNYLITDTENGRVLEIDPHQQLVWEYNNIYDNTRNGVISKAMVIPENYFLDGALKCRPDH